ncbi:hypothetical protein LCGC14_2736780, partial [marine sediment metagenome]
KEILEGRKIIEVSLTALAAERATHKDVKAIEGAIREMEKSIEDLDLFVAADMKFHLSIISSAHNNFLEEMYRRTSDILKHVISIIVQFPLVKDKALDMHWKILENIKLKDEEGARKASISHLRDVWNSIKMTLQISD